MANPWITHVREFAFKHGLTYSASLADPRCKASYTKVEKAPKPVKAPKVPRVKKVKASM